MDKTRFDSLVKLIGQGASRRSVLRGLLGLGGAAVAGVAVDESADARTARTRPTIPPPSPPPPTTTSTTAAPLCNTGQEQCPDSTLCCPTGTCARSGAAAICCDGTNGHGSTVCGLECCSQGPLQCCDRECCATDAVCLARVFEGSSADGEEDCCPIEQTCDGQCCDGACFFGLGSEPFPGPSPWERSCCPDQEGFTFCPGQGAFESTGLCCSGHTPDCCHDESGAPVCLTADQCCIGSECDGCSHCEDFTCVRNCSECCEVGEPADWICLPGECCPGIPDYCSDGRLCCPEEQQGFGTYCAECCLDSDCDGCSHCEDGACVAECSECCEVGQPDEWFCLPGECCPGIPGYCGGGQFCCPEAQPGFGTTCEACCADGDCGTNTACSIFTCEAHQCRQEITVCEFIDHCTSGCDPEIGCPAVSACPPGTTCCDDGACVDLSIPGNCCGSAQCNDGNACTSDSCNLQTHTCQHFPLICVGDVCTPNPVCDPQTGCPPSSCAATGQTCCVDGVCRDSCGCTSDTECNDGNACTNDFCSGPPGQAVCVNAPIICEDNNPCTTNSCNPASGCIYTPVDCSGSSNAAQCLAGTCDPSTGSCFGQSICTVAGTACCGDGTCGILDKPIETADFCVSSSECCGGCCIDSDLTYQTLTDICWGAFPNPNCCSVQRAECEQILQEMRIFDVCASNRVVTHPNSPNNVSILPCLA